MLESLIKNELVQFIEERRCVPEKQHGLRCGARTSFAGLAPKRKAVASKAAGKATTPTKKAKNAVNDRTLSSTDTNATDEPKTTKIIIKGKVPVDSQCVSKVDTAHVLQSGNDVYHFMLNQTNLQHNNNKYFLGQVLEDDIGGGYAVWFRWGRVGKTAQSSLQSCGSSDQAVQIFTTKFRSKTRNFWHNRSNFTKVDGQYDLIEQDFEETDADNTDTKKDNAEEEAKKKVESTLPIEVFGLISMIGNINTMEQQMREMKYDARRAPLGKLTTAQIKAGYAALKEIAEFVEELEKLKNPPAAKIGKRGTKRQSSATTNIEEIRARLLKACNQFYTKIPHNFGMRVPPMIETPDALKTELDLMKALEDIEVAFDIIKMDKNVKDVHPADSHYQRLQCDIKPLIANDKMDRIIRDYVRLTHAPTHSNYDLEVIQIFNAKKTGEAENFIDYGGRYLLWHGSRITNWMGILGRGLRIAPPEAPSTGYMFGKGVYFADCASKSANYTYTNKQNNIGIMALCEVSLGETNDLLCSDYNASNLPAGKHSTKGVGRNMPDSSTWITLDDGVVVPCGEIVDSKVTNGSLYYNEFIVYNTAQIKLRYLVQLKFHYKY